MSNAARPLYIAPAKPLGTYHMATTSVAGSGVASASRRYKYCRCHRLAHIGIINRDYRGTATAVYQVHNDRGRSDSSSTVVKTSSGENRSDPTVATRYIRYLKTKKCY